MDVGVLGRVRGGKDEEVDLKGTCSGGLQTGRVGEARKEGKSGGVFPHCHEHGTSGRGRTTQRVSSRKRLLYDGINLCIAPLEKLKHRITLFFETSRAEQMVSGMCVSPESCGCSD